jgi:hypothetical protein
MTGAAAAAAAAGLAIGAAGVAGAEVMAGAGVAAGAGVTVAVAADNPLPDATVPVIDLNNIDAIADLLLKHAVSVKQV